ncbi:MAG: tyrosine-type recombinase/integrase [Hyphomicrobiaceae bacterium]
MPRNKNRHDNWTHENWPEPFQSSWTSATAPSGIFWKGGPASRLKPRTVWNNERAFGRYQEFLRRTGRRDQGLLPEISNLRAFENELAKDLAPYSRLSIITQITGALRLMFPDADLKYLNIIARRLETVARPVRPVTSRLVDPVTLRMIAIDIMQGVTTESTPSRRDAQQFMVGALINAVALFPLRMNNWRIAVIGHHISLDSGEVRFDAEEMKRKEPFEGKLEAEALEPLVAYVEKYRASLLDRNAVDQGYLWPSRTGSICHRNTLGRAVKSVMRRKTGKDFNFHLFRHGAATFVAENKPEQMRMAANVLQHTSLRTTREHYIRGKRRRAFGLYQIAIREILAKGRRNRSCRDWRRKRG